MSQPQAPQRFSLASILAMMTTFALLFGGLRLLNAETAVYVYFGSLAMSISIAQMVFGLIPKGGSTILGGLLLPVCLIVQVAWNGQDLNKELVGLPCTVVMGAVLGYCTGALAAGVFSLLQMVEPFLVGSQQRRQSRQRRSQNRNQIQDDVDNLNHDAPAEEASSEGS